MNKGYKFESETDTEVVIKLVKYLYDKHKNENISFQKLIEMACSQLVIDLGFCLFNLENIL
jgi:glucosamine--fructose-6-phosphate aminotransferase (isomerizing)